VANYFGVPFWATEEEKKEALEKFEFSNA